MSKARVVLDQVEQRVPGQGARLNLKQVQGILKANKLWPNKLEIGEIKLPTGARIVVEDQGKMKAFYLRVNEKDTKDWKEAFWKHVEEAGGLGGYRARRMV